MASPNTAFRNLQEEQRRLEQEYASSHNSNNNNNNNLEAAAEASRKKSDDALRRYFSALSGNATYNNRREQAQDVQPFSFELRELTRPKSTTTLRAEQDKQQRLEEEDKHLKSKFKANPVPPSTFLPKYQIMVDEWCARKEAVKMVAEQRAKELKESSQVGKDFAKDWRKEQMKQHPRRADRTKTREQAWEEWKQKHCKPFKARPIPESTYIPNNLLEEEREASRADRVRARADQLLYESHAPARMEESLAECVKERANKIIETHEMKKLRGKEKAARQRSTLRHVNPNFTFQPDIHRDVPRFNELWAQERLRSAVSKQKIREELRKNEAGGHELAQSEQDGGFRALKEHAVMSDTHKYAKLERAKRKFLQVTKGKVTPEEELQRRLGGGHDEKDIDPVVATILLEQSTEELLHRKNGIDAALFLRSSSARPSRSLDVPCQRPRTTHAHVVKSASTYKNIVAEEQKALEEDKFEKERARRNREVYDRLLRAGLVQPGAKRPASAGPRSSKGSVSSTTNSSVIDWDAKLADRKKAQKQETKDQQKRLAEMKEKVQSQPPIFVAEQQATYAFADLTKARADAEAQIMSAWKQAGLDVGSAQQMMMASGGGNSNSNNNGTPPPAATAAASARDTNDDTIVSPMSNPTASARNTDGGGMIGEVNQKKKQKDEFEASSSSSDDDDDSSSSSSSSSDSSSSSGSSSSSDSSSSSSSSDSD